MQQITKQTSPSGQLFERINLASMKISDFLVKIAFFEHFSYCGEICVTRYCRDVALQSGSNAWLLSFKKKRSAQKMVILTKRSKIFIKPKLILSKNCLLELVCLVICCNLRDVPILITEYLGRTNFYSKTDSTGKFSNDLMCLKYVQSPRRLTFTDFSFSNE